MIGGPQPIRLPRGLFAVAVLLFTLLPLVELLLLLWMGRTVGFGPTILLCASTGFLGAWLARAQGLQTVLSAQREMAAGRFPGQQLLDGACLLVGGVVLLTPGLITDAVGFLLLLPASRRLLQHGVRRWWQAQQGIIDIQPPP